MTMIGDWMLETSEPIETIIASAELGLAGPKGTEDMQVIPSGPGEGDDGLLQMLLAVINSAREELILTTPYFVPDDSMLRALRGAAGRGVRVDMILPERVDSLMTRYASRSYYGELLDIGVRIYLYQKGLLHTKSITADRRISMFGTVNLDMRSLWLNYEVSLFVYGEAFAGQLYDLQQSYLQDCRQIDPRQWSHRSRISVFWRTRCGCETGAVGGEQGAGSRQPRNTRNTEKGKTERLMARRWERQNGSSHFPVVHLPVSTNGKRVS